MSKIMSSDFLDLAIQKSLEKEDLSNCKGYKKPLKLDGYSSTPEDLRVQFQIYKSAGIVPPEVELMQKRERFEQEIQNENLSDEQLYDLKKKLSILNAEISIRL